MCRSCGSAEAERLDLQPLAKLFCCKSNGSAFDAFKSLDPFLHFGSTVSAAEVLQNVDTLCGESIVGVIVVLMISAATTTVLVMVVKVLVFMMFMFMILTTTAAVLMVVRMLMFMIFMVMILATTDAVIIMVMVLMIVMFFMLIMAVMRMLVTAAAGICGLHGIFL